MEAGPSTFFSKSNILQRGAGEGGYQSPLWTRELNHSNKKTRSRFRVFPSNSTKVHSPLPYLPCAVLYHIPSYHPLLYISYFHFFLSIRFPPTSFFSFLPVLVFSPLIHTPPCSCLFLLLSLLPLIPHHSSVFLISYNRTTSRSNS